MTSGSFKWITVNLTRLHTHYGALFAGRVTIPMFPGSFSASTVGGEGSTGQCACELLLTWHPRRSLIVCFPGWNRSLVFRSSKPFILRCTSHGGRSDSSAFKFIKSSCPPLVWSVRSAGSLYMIAANALVKNLPNLAVRSARIMSLGSFIA